jgi:hypothetical protein
VLNKVRITSIAAAALLASPAFAAWPFDQPAQAEQIEDQRIIREVVVNGGLIEADSDEDPPMSSGRFQIGSTKAALRSTASSFTLR